MTLDAFCERFGYTFRDQALLNQALTHRSLKRQIEHADNERLEFLGDSVLGLVLSEAIFQKFSNADEGQLSKKRASLVNREMLAHVGRTLQLAEVLKTGLSDAEKIYEEKPRLLASALEALYGAIFVDAGYEAAKNCILSHFKGNIESIELVAEEYPTDYKTRLQEVLQKKYGEVPSYQLIAATGPDHQKVFEVEVVIQERTLARGEGGSKKAASQEAARKALEIVNNED